MIDKKRGNFAQSKTLARALKSTRALKKPQIKHELSRGFSDFSAMAA